MDENKYLHFEGKFNRGFSAGAFSRERAYSSGVGYVSGEGFSSGRTYIPSRNSFQKGAADFEYLAAIKRAGMDIAGAAGNYSSGNEPGVHRFATQSYKKAVEDRRATTKYSGATGGTGGGSPLGPSRGAVMRI